MGARGSLKLVAGNGVVQAAPDSAQARVAPIAPNPPKCITDDDKLLQLWNDVVPGLDRAGLLTEADTMTVAAAIMHFATMKMAYDELSEYDSVIVDSDDSDTDHVKKNPAEHIMRLQSGLYMEYAKQLGMTWMARARTTIPKEASERGNPFAPGEASGG